MYGDGHRGRARYREEVKVRDAAVSVPADGTVPAYFQAVETPKSRTPSYVLVEHENPDPQREATSLNPNPPKDTDGRREESGRGVRELQGK